MHPELVVISNVWQRDARIDKLKAEHEALTGAVAAATKAREAALGALSAADAAVEKVRREERASARGLDEYVQKRDATQRLIDSGIADYAAAQRQLESCLRLIDELETKGLEILDQLDTAEAAQVAAKKDLAAAEAALAEAKAHLALRDTPIRLEMAEQLTAREVAWAALPHEHRSPYSELRRRKRPVLVNSVDGNCAHCHMRIPPQRLVEVGLDRAVHTCPGCQGYVLP